jgi:hypothetical protein
MSSESEYRRWAADCLDLGKRAAELTDRTRLLVIAEAWLELADRIGRANRRPARQTIDNTVAEHPLVTNAAAMLAMLQLRAAPAPCGRRTLPRRSPADLAVPCGELHSRDPQGS